MHLRPPIVRRLADGVGYTLLLAVVVTGSAPTPAAGQEAATVSGRVVDAQSRQPIPGAAVRVVGFPFEALTGEDGVFSLRGVPAGAHDLELQHVAYGRHARAIAVEAERDLVFEVSLSQQAIELEPIVVESLTGLDERRASTGFSMREVLLEDIEQAARIGQTLAQLLQYRLPGALVRGPCIDARAVRGGRCAVGIVMDGVPVSDPESILTGMRLSDVERLELLSAGEAGARYGSLGANGVLLIETRRGVRPGGDRGLARSMTTHDWATEAAPHRSRRVFWSAFLVNAVGVGVSLALSDSCFRTTRDASLGLRTECNGVGTVGAGFVSVALPSVGGTLAGRWAGSTERSQGRVMPAVITGALGLMAGYMLVIHGDPWAEATGVVTLGLAVPVLSTVSDRMFRTLR